MKKASVDSADGTAQTVESMFSGGGEMGERMRSLDWSKTPLGPADAWPQSLKTSISTCLNSRFAILIWWGKDLVKIYNDTYVSILGNKHPRALGAPGREIWPELWHIIGPMLAGVMERGQATWSENLLLEMNRNGYEEECYFTFSYSPIRDESGGVGGIFTPVQETTTQVIGQRRLRTLRDLAEATRIASVGSTEDLCRIAAQTLSANPFDIPFAAFYLFIDGDKVARLSGAAGVPSGITLLPEIVDLEKGDWLFSNIVRSGASQLIALPPGLQDLPRGAWPVPPTEVMVLPITPTGQRIGFFLLAVNPRKRLDDEYRGFLSLIGSSVNTAVAEARAMENERKRVQVLAELDRSKNQFFANLSHEFRTPLTLMLGPVEGILAKSEDQVYPDNREMLKTVYRNGLRLLRLVNTLLEFSRIEAGRVQATYEPTDLPTFTADLASSFRSTMDLAALDYYIECLPFSGLVYIDREMWEKVVFNLISNAFKFTLQGSVAVRLMEDDGFARLSVTDTGVGIPSGELDLIFDRFHRVEHTRSRTHEGSGIGLALVQELVKLHGGTVSVESTPGKGSTFNVLIPLGSRHLPQERIQEEVNRPLTNSHSGVFVDEALGWLPRLAVHQLPVGEIGVNPPGPIETLHAAAFRSRVLLAEDNADMRDYVRRLLSPLYEVTVAANGAEALSLAQENPPDLVLSDIMMPIMDGVTLLRSLRSHPILRLIPVIFLSARAGEEASMEGLGAGADDYLIKPFTARELLARVGAHLAIKRERQRAHEQLNEVFSQAPVGIAVLRGPEFIVELANPFYRALLQGRELVGRRFADVVPELGQEVWDVFNRVMSTGKPFVANDWLVPYDADGDGRSEDHWFNLVYHPLRESDGTVSGFLAVATEVTAQLLARRDLERANRKLEEFAYVASHDLQEPLRMVNIYSEMLLKRLGEKDETSQQYRDFIREGVLRMERLIRDLLAYSRTVHEDASPVGVADLSASLNESLSIFKLKTEEAGAIITFDPLPVVRGDTLQLRHVFQNLISNALKYRRPDVIPTIHISATTNGGKCVCSIRDNGIGFKQEYAERIFGLFKRLHKDEYPGTGLGLAICQRIVERYGGRMWAEGCPGEGSTFYFELPCTEAN